MSIPLSIFGCFIEKFLLEKMSVPKAVPFVRSIAIVIFPGLKFRKANC